VEERSSGIGSKIKGAFSAIKNKITGNDADANVVETSEKHVYKEK